jgi:hypothetical protein
VLMGSKGQFTSKLLVPVAAVMRAEAVLLGGSGADAASA